MTDMLHPGFRRGSILSLLILFVSMTLTATGQTRGEYFWNSDPGIGRANKMSQSGEADGYRSFSIDAAGLAPGANILGYRAFSGGRWSHTGYSIVMVDADIEAAEWKAEYFWDTDPGIGKATPLDISFVSEEDMIDVEMLADGIVSGTHTIGIRTNSGRMWSHTVISTVIIPEKRQYGASGAEYFWDTDPGIGKATPLDISSVSGDGVVDVAMLAEGLAPGTHTIGMRTRTDKMWSHTVTSTVTIPDNREYEVSAAEYFWGKDPGLGKGTPIAIKPGETVDIETLEIDFPQTPADEYVLSFRARSEKGWGTTVSRVIPHLYVESITLCDSPLRLAKGSESRIEAVVMPADAFVAELIWTSSHPEIATVDSEGNVKAIAEGTAVVTASSTDGTGVSASVEVVVMEPVASVILSKQELTMQVSHSVSLSATVNPSDATSQELIWSVEGDDCVSVDADGTVTAQKKGEAVVKATAADGFGAEACCRIKVVALRGDADGSGTLAVNDVVLTARGVVGDMDSRLDMEAVDLNLDGTLTVGDLTGVVGEVLEYKSPSWTSARIACKDLTDGSLGLEADGMSVSVMPEDCHLYCGIQFDVMVSEGLAVTGVELEEDACDGHSISVRRHEDSVRALSYATEHFRGGTGMPLARIGLKTVEGAVAGVYDVYVVNVMASDREGNLYRLPDSHITVTYDQAAGLDAVDDNGLVITVNGRWLTIESPTDTVVSFTGMHGISRLLEIKAGVNRMLIDTAGIYAVNGRKIIIR